ncbi:hypothetical protein [uncultured Alistipes sp.]|uniref:hypothetical protein n=1 Tax=uncultured Alistipes sp. TaxID=538949 RepID=UPI00266EC582|nr:hypothetical protein [uncultured Alistipes sp.]
MLSFTTQPADCVPAGQRAEYRLACDPAQTVDIRITDSQTDELLGTKRFVDVAEAVFDAAPVVRRHIAFAPESGTATGFIANTDRICSVKVSAAPTDAPAQAVVSSASVYYAATEAAPIPSLLTAMPLQRLLAPGEQDEITLLKYGLLRMTVTAKGPAGERTQNYTSTSTPIHLFRLCADDFPDAEQLTLDFAGVGTVVYTTAPKPHDACRLAWRSRAGSLEHYTFPTEVCATVEASKTRICGPDGYSTTASTEKRRTRLRSAYETRAAAEALAEIVASPQVWRVAGGRYEPVDVVTDTAVLQRQGVLNMLEIEIRPCKTDRPWR